LGSALKRVTRLCRVTRFFVCHLSDKHKIGRSAAVRQRGVAFFQIMLAIKLGENQTML
jgi:hypothetical protein